MRKQEIVELARGLKETYKTNDPYELANIFGIRVLEKDHSFKGFKAQAVKFRGYAPYIAINANYTELAKKVLCAHELGHILLHAETLNYFADIGGKINMETEYEANLFVLALLEDQARLKVDMTEISPYMLQTIIESNIELK